MFDCYRESIYIQVKKDCFHLRNCKTNREHLEMSDLPFSTERLAVGDFYAADKALRNGLSEILSKTMFKLPPIIIVHQRYLCEGGLSNVEERVLFELSHSTKVHKVVVWQGRELSKEDIVNKVYETS
ncbi:putative uncharacterized protein [Aliivibrio wodanis]|uniref:Uncharacterized protein n=2 Tax=Aliivibrio wodanis TaxID=80852 RepID=A0A090ILY8_9GAMM|nr:putative uncharacterized protein [Aliivibrio wodanis]VVV04032.1 hypothetical protein AW0309160_01415 [Aliivibrio wodanis]